MTSNEIDETTFENTDDLIEYLRVCTNEGFTWFRGQSRSEWRLHPQVCRDPRHNEHGLLKSFWQRSASFAEAPHADDLAHWISLAQHYGVPTRALDWSESYLVALYFAASRPLIFEKEDADSADFAVWVLNPIALNRSMLGEHIETETGGRQPVGVCSEQDTPVLGHMMRAFGFEWHESSPDYVAYSPQFRYLRMANQKAAFTWHRANDPMDQLASAKHFLRKIVFRGAVRNQISADLTILGVTHSLLFPDFEGVAHELKTRGIGSRTR